MAQCPYCGKQNQPDSAFCIHCGEPTDNDSVRDFFQARYGDNWEEAPQYRGSISKAANDNLRFSLRDLFSPQRSLEFLIGMLVATVAIGFGIYFSTHQENQSAHYRAGLADIAKHDYESALSEFLSADGYLDTPGKLKNVQDKLATRDRLYREAIDAGEQGKMWLAAADLQQVVSVTENYKDAPALLERARQTNGQIVYRAPLWTATGGGDGGGLYIAQADGGKPHQLPGSSGLSTIFAISPDGKWAVYNDFAPPKSRKLYLYDVDAEAAWEIALPVEATPTSARAGFSADSRTLWVDVSGKSFAYDIPRTWRTVQPLQPVSADEARAREQLQSPLLVVGQGPEPGSTSLWVDGPNESLRPVAVEKGHVDGAVFSAGQRYLLYRACNPAGDLKGYACSLKLVDLSLAQPEPTIIGSLPVKSADGPRWSINGEFTRDDKHVLIMIRYGGESSANLYNLDTGALQVLETANSDEKVLDLDRSPLMGLGEMGLQQWKGSNSLAYADGTTPLDEGEGSLSDRSFGRSHWLTISQGNGYAVYLTHNAASGKASVYEVYSRPFGKIGGDGDVQNQQAIPLLQTNRPANEWLSMSFLLPDGKTMLSVAAPRPGVAPGLYGYDLQTGQATLAVPDAIEMWRAGYSSLAPAIPDTPIGK